MNRPIAALLLALAVPGGAAPPHAASRPTCTMAAPDRAWLTQALANWRIAERTLLKLPRHPLPKVIAINAHCTYESVPGRNGFGWRGAPHGPQVRVPDGKMLPVGPISFASNEAGGFFAMSLPSVWRAAGVKSGLGLERLMDGVMLHELMHTRQFYFADAAIAAAAKALGPSGDDADDDALQGHFKSDPAYVAAYEAERDTLFAAAAAPGDAAARRLAGKALAMMRARRARFLSGANAAWLPFDDIFLDMEGLGQWLAYAWYVSPEGVHLPRVTVLKEVRRGGKYWTQDEGLALFLTVDRLVPGWQRLAFAEKPLLAEALLARAAGER